MKDVSAVLSAAQPDRSVVVEPAVVALQPIDEQMTMSFEVEKRLLGRVPVPAVVAEPRLIQANVERPFRKKAAATVDAFPAHGTPLRFGAWRFSLARGVSPDKDSRRGCHGRSETSMTPARTRRTPSKARRVNRSRRKRTE